MRIKNSSFKWHFVILVPGHNVSFFFFFFFFNFYFKYYNNCNFVNSYNANYQLYVRKKEGEKKKKKKDHCSKDKYFETPVESVNFNSSLN